MSTLTAKNINANDIVEGLRILHKRDLHYDEVRLSSGFELQSRIDFLAISPEPSTGNKATAYEIKVSRSDFKRDTYDKQRGARLYSDKFFYVAPKGMIKTEEIPDWAGLMEAKWYTYYGGESRIIFETTIPAPKRDKEPPSWGLLCSILRKDAKNVGI